jgi:3-dehydroquinate dehydratase-2
MKSLKDAQGAQSLPLLSVVTYNRPTHRHIAGIWMAKTPIKPPTKTPAGMAAEMIYVLNGPHFDSMGLHERVAYGHADLAGVEKVCVDTAAKFGLQTECRQSSNEAELIELIREAQANKAAGIVINAGDISHRSIALHEALMAAEIPSIEVHTGNVHARDSFRHHSFTARAALATLAGFGIDGYRLAINGLAARIGVAAKA